MKKLINRWKKDIRTLKSFNREKRIFSHSIGNQMNQEFRDLVNPNWDDLNKYRAWFRSQEVSYFSQNGEDGLLLSIFSQIGITNYTFIEFGTGDGRQCNSANLIQNFGWKGLLIEGNFAKAASATKFYENAPVEVLNAFIKKDNINDLFRRGGVEGEIDLLSIDIDGNDYWVWEAINVVNPRVVVIEYNSSFGKEKAVTIPYKEDFERFKAHFSGIYHGLSLQAAVKLGKKKGYKYIGCESAGVNAFFIREDIPTGKFREVDPEEFFVNQFSRSQKYSLLEQQQILQDLPLKEV